jgi:hypothetical protein
MIKENDVVELQEDKPEFGLKKGDKGTVLMILSASPVFYEIEFMDDDGETLAVETINGDSVKLFWSAEI